jgi:hypothetical protein
MTPITTTFGINEASYQPSGASWQLAQGFAGPNGPIPISGNTRGIGIAGFPINAVPAACEPGHHATSGNLSQVPASVFSCLDRLGYHQFITYQPANRYWPFQFIEAGIFVALAALLIAVAFAVINRRDA